MTWKTTFILLVSIVILMFVYFNYLLPDEVTMQEIRPNMLIVEKQAEKIAQPIQEIKSNDIYVRITPMNKYEKNRILTAFNIIEKASEGNIHFVYLTNITYINNITEFNQLEGQEDILFTISKERPIKVNGNWESATIGVTEWIDDKVVITFYNIKSENSITPCIYPVVEIHEILHALNFEHINDIYNIMNPYYESDYGCRIPFEKTKEINDWGYQEDVGIKDILMNMSNPFTK